MATLTDTISQTLAVTGIPTVSITSAVGQVTVVTGGDDTVHVEATKRASGANEDAAQQALASMDAEITQQDDVITIVSHFANGWMLRGWQERSIDFVITVPARTNITAQQSAGGMQISGVRGQMGIRIDAGGLRMQDITGMLTLQSNAGGTEIDHFGGMLDLKSSAGTVKLRDITLTHDSRLKLSAGKLNFDGALVPGASLDVESSAGKVELHLPADTSARLDATATAGKIAIDGWPIAVKYGFGLMASAQGDLGENPAGPSNSVPPPAASALPRVSTKR